VARTIRTPRRRQAFLQRLGETGNVEAACGAVGIGRSAVYAWRREDPAFAAEWDEAIEAVMDAIEAKVIDQALHDDGPAGVTSRIFLLRHQRAAIYNPGMLLRHEAMRFAVEEKRQQLLAGLPSTTTADVTGAMIYPRAELERTLLIEGEAEDESEEETAA
jgi:hypothetical protein